MIVIIMTESRAVLTIIYQVLLSVMQDEPGELCSVERSLPTLWVGTSGGLVCVYEFTLGSTTDVEQPPPLKCVLGKHP